MSDNQVLLAPVPAVHLDDALSICAAQGEVAFGSNNWKLLHTVKKGTPVYVFASSTGVSEIMKHDFAPGRVVLKGIFSRWEESKAGVCKEPKKRPKSTLDVASGDSKWNLFWYLSNLSKISEYPTYLENFQFVGPNPPLGPTFATLKPSAERIID